MPRKPPAPGDSPPRLDRIERLTQERSDHAGHGPVPEIHPRRLPHAAPHLQVLDGVVAAHAQARRAGLLQRRAREAAVQAPEAVLAHDGADGMRRAREAACLALARVVDQRRLDALRRRDGAQGGEHAGRHAREHVAQRRERAVVPLEGVLGRVEAEEAHGVFGDAADDEDAALGAGLAVRHVNNDVDAVETSET